MSKQQLPPGIYAIETNRREHGRPVLNYGIVVELARDPMTHKRRQTRRHHDDDEQPFTTIKQAQAFQAKLKNQVNEQTYVQRSAMTIEQVVKAWLAGKSRISENSLDSYQQYGQCLIDAYGQLPIQALTKGHLDTLMMQLRDGTLLKANGKPRKKYTGTSRQYVLGRIRAILKSEVDQGNLQKNVALLVDMPRAVKREIKTLTGDEMTRVLDHTKHDLLFIAYLLGLYGLRRGEVAAVKHSDIDYEQRTLTIRRSLIVIAGKIKEVTPKTESGERTLPIPEPLYDALVAQKTHQEMLRVLHGDKYRLSGYVVTDEHGDRIKPDRIYRTWRRVCKALGLAVQRFHDTRHTCGTLMAYQNVPGVIIAAWLGHKDSAFTYRTYVQKQPHMLNLAGASLNALINGGAVSRPSGDMNGDIATAS